MLSLFNSADLVPDLPFHLSRWDSRATATKHVCLPERLRRSRLGQGSSLPTTSVAMNGLLM